MPLNDIEVTGKPVDRGEEILTPQALEFLAHLHRRFAARRDELLALRAERRTRLAAGETLDFLPETR
jgi:malate synthase